MKEISVDFDYASMEGWDVPIRNIDMERGILAFERLLAWVYRDGDATASGIRVRSYVLWWMIRPQSMGNPTQTQMAKRLGISKKSFCTAVSSFRDTFPFYNGLVRSEEVRQHCSMLRREYHKRKSAEKEKVLAATPGKESFSNSGETGIRAKPTETR